MPTAPYKNSKGERLSGGTTIIGGNCGWKGPGLMIWKENQCIDAAINLYYELGEGVSLDKFSSKLREKIKEKGEEAPTAGTIAHNLIECDLKKQEPNTSQY